MSRNKQVVKQYMEAFNRTDHEAILSLLTDDVEWIIPGMFHVQGKTAFDREIENDGFVGSPAITVTRLTEQDDVVVAEGQVRIRDARRANPMPHVVLDGGEVIGADLGPAPTAPHPTGSSSQSNSCRTQ